MNEQVVSQMIEEDAMLRFVKKDLLKRNLPLNETVEVIYNSYIIDDPIMEKRYNDLCRCA